MICLQGQVQNSAYYLFSFCFYIFVASLQQDKLYKYTFLNQNFACLFVFRCEGGQRQLPGSVGVCQRYYCSDSTGVKGTQLSGISALLRGNAVVWPAKIIFFKTCFPLYCFLMQPVQLFLLIRECMERRKRERPHCTLTIHTCEEWPLCHVHENYNSESKIGHLAV